jgi:hypothetical protein
LLLIFALEAANRTSAGLSFREPRYSGTLAHDDAVDDILIAETHPKQKRSLSAFPSGFETKCPTESILDATDQCGRHQS